MMWSTGRNIERAAGDYEMLGIVSILEDKRYLTCVHDKASPHPFGNPVSPQQAGRDSVGIKDGRGTDVFETRRHSHVGPPFLVFGPRRVQGPTLLHLQPSARRWAGS